MGIAMMQSLPPIWLVMLYYFLRSLGDTFYHPASQVMIPNLVERDQLVQANGIEQSAQTGGSLLGPMVGALVIARFGYPAVFFADAIGFIISVITLGIIKVQETRKPLSEGPGLNVAGFVAELKEGLLYIKTKAVIMQLMLFFSIINFCAAGLGVVMPFYVSERLANGGIDAMAKLSTASAAGGLVVTLGISTLKRMPHRGKVAVLSMLIYQASQMLFGFQTSLVPAMVLSATRSVAMAGGMASSAIYQNEVEPYIRGRVFSFRSMLSTALNPLGVAVAGIAGEYMPAWMVISVFGAIGTLTSILAMFSKRLWNA